MAEVGWKRLLRGWPWFRGKGRFPIEPPTEFIAPIHVLRKPYGTWDPVQLDEADPYGWPVTEYEEALSLRPGFDDIGRIVLQKLTQLAQGKALPEFAGQHLHENPYWPGVDPPKHERFVLLLPIALSQTSDEKGRVNWTVYGASEQGPARPFWKSFYTAPNVERPANEAIEFFGRLLSRVYGERNTEDLRAAGFRILPQGRLKNSPFPDEGPVPSWCSEYLWHPRDTLAGVNYLLTFRPYRLLPESVRRAYRSGKLRLLPYPGSLLFWGVGDYIRLSRQLPFAMQIPLLHLLERQHRIDGLRVPQSGWFEEPLESGETPHQGEHGPLRERTRRPHRREYILRHEDNLASAREHWLVDALFSTEPNHIGLYEKPLARNAQLWTHDFDLLLDGPIASGSEIRRIGELVERGGVFGYRFITPPMRVGEHEVYWQRPLVAYQTPAGRAAVMNDVPMGYLTAYELDKPDFENPIELWPRVLDRELHRANIEQFLDGWTENRQETLLNVRKLLEARELHNSPLPSGLARALLTLDKNRTIEGWLRSLPKRARDLAAGRSLAQRLRELIVEAPAKNNANDSLTYHRTATREFEVAYWEAIADMSTGDYLNTNNADCVLDAATQAALQHHHRDLEPLGEYLLTRHLSAIAEHQMSKRALAGELPFSWEGYFNFEWMGGFKANRDGRAHERNLLVVIPGRDRSRAVVLADHYDTAYMEDRYEAEEGGNGARLAAAGADDNCSASAALLMAAPVFLDMSRAGRLGCDVWLLHITGEEFPAAGLGAAQFIKQLVEGSLKVGVPGGKTHELGSTQIQGLIVMDMIAHNTRRQRDVFQIAPGSGVEAWRMACHLQDATRIWNDSIDQWNANRRGASRGRRRRSGRKVPDVARHPRLHGEIRPEYDPRSTLYNTDGQAFSDCGVPVVLLMENYDINRRGYHDSFDTLANIDLDYGAALAAIAIEAAARAAQ